MENAGGGAARRPAGRKCSLMERRSPPRSFLFGHFQASPTAYSDEPSRRAAFGGVSRN